MTTLEHCQRRIQKRRFFQNSRFQAIQRIRAQQRKLQRQRRTQKPETSHDLLALPVASSIPPRALSSQPQQQPSFEKNHSMDEEHPDDTNDDENSNNDLLSFDVGTAAVLQAHVELLLQDDSSTNATTTVLSLANSLFGSTAISDAYAKLGDDVVTTRRRFEKLWTRRRLPWQQKQQNDPGMQRRYDWVRALNQLQEQPGASTRVVRTWADARRVLSSVVRFPAPLVLAGDADASTSSLLSSTEAFSTDSVQALHERLQTVSLETLGLRTSQHAWQELAAQSRAATLAASHRIHADDDSRLAQALADRSSDTAQAVREVAERQKQAALEKEAQEAASKLLRPLNPEERALVSNAMNTGYDDDLVGGANGDGIDSCSRQSLRTLQPGEWLNDDAIHSFLVTLAARDEALCRDQARDRRSHFFKSFFVTKLRNEGHPKLHGVYEYKNVKRWSKKVPGKDIFKLDKIIFPINQGNSHWVSAVAFMKECKIQFYDSMGGSGMPYLEDLLRYLQDEHLDKKKSPLPGDWTLVPCTQDTPRQRNGFDCGVFTCMFADFVSKDCPLAFQQQHITQCRERIALAILKGEAIV